MNDVPTDAKVDLSAKGSVGGRFIRSILRSRETGIALAIVIMVMVVVPQTISSIPQAATRESVPQSLVSRDISQPTARRSK